MVRLLSLKKKDKIQIRAVDRPARSLDWATVKIIREIVLVRDWDALYKTPNKQYLVGSETGA